MPESETKWDAFAAAGERLHGDMDFRAVVIRQWDSTYDPETGNYVDALESRDAGHRVSMELRQPTMPRTATGPDGGESEIDVEGHVRVGDLDPGPEEIVEAGGESRASVVTDTMDGTDYEVWERFAENNGLLILSMVER